MHHYRNSLSNEFKELGILEKKACVQELLFQTMVSEPGLEEMLNVSPYVDIRREAFEFIFLWKILEISLTYFIRDLEQNGKESWVYREFLTLGVDIFVA